MKKLSSKSALLFGVVLAVSAFAVPSMASAASWGVIGTPHLLTSTNLSFFQQSSLNAGSSCADSTFNASVDNADVLTITAATFTGCTGLGNAIGCTATPTATGFPWIATAATTTDIRIRNIHFIIHFETKPGGAAGSCPTGLHGQSVTLTGTLGNGTAGQTSWVQASHTLSFNNATGLTVDVPGAALGTVVNGTIIDRTQTLSLVD